MLVDVEEEHNELDKQWELDHKPVLDDAHQGDVKEEHEDHKVAEKLNSGCVQAALGNV